MVKKRKFSVAERWAVFSVHGERCYLDGHPVNFKSMQVDHIIPESLLGQPDRLREIVRLFGLPEDFNINSYQNWLPACQNHNIDKGNKVFNPSPLIQSHLESACRLAEKAAKIELETISDRKLSRALGVIETAASQRSIPPEFVDRLVQALSDIRIVRNVSDDGEGNVFYHVDWRKYSKFALESMISEILRHGPMLLTPFLSIAVPVIEDFIRSRIDRNLD